MTRHAQFLVRFRKAECRLINRTIEDTRLIADQNLVSTTVGGGLNEVESKLLSVLKYRLFQTVEPNAQFEQVPSTSTTRRCVWKPICAAPSEIRVSRRWSSNSADAPQLMQMKKRQSW